MNIAQFRINGRFDLSLSDLGQDQQGFEAMLIDNKSKNDIALNRGDKNIEYIELKSNSWKVYNVAELQIIIEEAKLKANLIIQSELTETNKSLFIN